MPTAHLADEDRICKLKNHLDALGCFGVVRCSVALGSRARRDRERDRAVRGAKLEFRVRSDMRMRRPVFSRTQRLQR